VLGQDTRSDRGTIEAVTHGHLRAHSRFSAACHETLASRDLSRGGRRERHDEPQPFEAAGQSANGALRVEGIEIGGAKLAIGGRAAQEVIGGKEDLVRDRHDRTLVAAADAEPMKFLAEVGVLGAGRRLRGFHVDETRPRHHSLTPSDA